jgi:hypothetical protein
MRLLLPLQLLDTAQGKFPQAPTTVPRQCRIQSGRLMMEALCCSCSRFLLDTVLVAPAARSTHRHRRMSPKCQMQQISPRCSSSPSLTAPPLSPAIVAIVECHRTTAKLPVFWEVRITIEKILIFYYVFGSHPHIQTTSCGKLAGLTLTGRTVIPPALQAATPIELRATAGLRLLPRKQAAIPKSRLKRRPCSAYLYHHRCITMALRS